MTDPAHGPSIHLKDRDGVRVSLTLLDTLMNLAGELVLSRNQLLRMVNDEDLKGIAASSQRIDLITSELQDAIMKIRMQPVDKLLKVLSEQAGQRDGADDTGPVFHLQGNQVELDKSILESLRLPLEELLDHLVEMGTASPGSSSGREIILSADQDAGQVYISFKDETLVVAPDTSLDWALSRGLISEDRAADLTDRQKLELGFLRRCRPSDALSDSPSDIGTTVADYIESLGGALDLRSDAETGTRIRIKLPLTLAIIPSQITSVGAERYALPQANLDELLRIPAAQVKERIEKVGDSAVVRLRGELLPVLDLAGLLGIQRRYRDPESETVRPDRRKNISDRRSPQLMTAEAPSVPGSGERRTGKDEDRRRHSSSAFHIAVLSAGAYRYGLVVDGFLDVEEIVVKSLGRHMRGCTAYAGATIMGDGTVALILDIANLARLGGLAETLQRISGLTAAKENEHPENHREGMILFRNLEEEYFCAPQQYVERIDRISSDRIETLGNKRVVQHQGRSLPLYGLNEVADVGTPPRGDTQEILVIKTPEKEFGLMVTPPVDTVDRIPSLDTSVLKGRAVKGSAVINGRTTLVLDIEMLVRMIS